MNNYKPVIGLEVHVELKTKSKMFCSCSTNYFGNKPNTHTCPVCLGMPGALPVPNKTAIDWCVSIGMALNCDIALFSKFDRKNYFYPDLAKGYQISQYDEPFGTDGHIILSSGKKIRIRRVHMEEDTGKLTHGDENGKRVSLIDFNRSGIPLVEIVTEPDFDNALDVKEYLQKLQQIVRYLQVSNADMEKGDMRLEPNISLQKDGQTELPHYKVEVKNINSFKFVEKAINYEINRQSELLNENQTPLQETRGWNESKQKTVSQRIKEEANDYRYFPDPDIPPIRFTEEEISTLASHMPELPTEKQERFVNDYSLSSYDAEILTREIELADYFEKVVKSGKDSVTPKQIANFIINKKTDITLSPEELVTFIQESSKVAQVDEGALQTIISEVITEQEKAVQDYKSGKESVIMFLVGQVMRKSKEKLDATKVKELLQSTLK